jgi:hypothetical protein
MRGLCVCESPDTDSLVFDRNDLRAMPPRVHLWKKISTWVKPTQHFHSSCFYAFAACSFDRARETKTEFAICAKTPIPSGFSLILKFRAIARADARVVVACDVFAIACRRKWRWLLRLRTPSVKWTRCFFFRASVIGMQCTSIRGGTVPTSPHHRG